MTSTFNSLNRRLDRIADSLPRRDTNTFEWDYSLFNPVEQAELQLFMESFPREMCETNKLDSDQLAQLGCWVRLEKALRDGDMVEAEKWRRRRATSLETLVDKFLNLDISSLPTDCNVPGPSIEENGCIYHFNRTHYRQSCWLVSRAPERRRDDMWRWIEYFESQ